MIRMLIIAVGCISVYFVLVLVGPLLVSVNDAEPVIDHDISNQMSNVIAAVDQAVSMLFALTFGMFVVVALLLKEAPRSGLHKIVLAPLIFFIFSAASLYFGFLARMAVLNKSNYQTLPLEGVETLIGRQGMAVALSAVPLLIICYDLLLSSKHFREDDQ